MKKNNKKGFFLAETMVVIAVVAVVLLGLFKLFSSVYNGFKESQNYNTVISINALSNIRKYYESLGDIDITGLNNDVSYLNLTNASKYVSDYYNKIIEEFNINSIYLINLDTFFESNAIQDFNVNFRRYLNTLKNVNGIVLVIMLDGNEFAYSKLDDSKSVSLIGDPNDEYVLYVPIGGEFIDPGYENWDGEEPIKNWENDVEIDTSKSGMYYLHYDFNGYLFRRKVVVGKISGVSYIDNLLLYEKAYNNGLEEIKINNNGVEYNAGIRYVGQSDDVNNYVYFNCDEKDSNNVLYLDDGYDYASSCELWRIIGVFSENDGTGNIERRLKLVNTSSTFSASWDSSASSVNGGAGINEWGESTYFNGNTYLGSDIMQLLNGYYIGKEGSTCGYNISSSQSGFSKTCDTNDVPLASKNMKPLTNLAKLSITNTEWFTYGVSNTSASGAYLEERGITKKYTGCAKNESTTTTECQNDGVRRNNKWNGLVGLMSVSDVGFANGWLYQPIYQPYTITPRADDSNSSFVWRSRISFVSSDSASNEQIIWPSVYLKSDIDIISGNGTELLPYIIS